MEIRRPILKPFSKDKFELVQEYQYKEITVSTGYKTNGANVPRIFWSIFPPNSPEYLSATLVHDWLCKLADPTNFTEAEEIFFFNLPKPWQDITIGARYKIADKYLKEMMSELGCSKLKVWIFYTACRLWHKIKYGA